MVLRPLPAGDEAELLRIRMTPEVMALVDVPDEGLPWTDEPEAIRLTIEHGAAMESNHPSVGLPRPAGFEDHR